MTNNELKEILEDIKRNEPHSLTLALANGLGLGKEPKTDRITIKSKKHGTVHCGYVILKEIQLI